MTLPFTATQPKPAECLVSLLLRPIVCPEVFGLHAGEDDGDPLFVPGNLVSNLDFVESIFGNGGGPAPFQRTMPRSTGALDRPYGLRHPCAASGQGHEKIRRPPGLERSDGAPAPRRNVLETGGRTLQPRRRVQANLPRRVRRHCDSHRGQLFRLLQERGQDADQFLGEPFSVCVKRSTRVARWSFPATILVRSSAVTCMSRQWAIRSRRWRNVTAGCWTSSRQVMAWIKNFHKSSVSRATRIFDLYTQRVSWEHDGITHTASSCNRTKPTSGRPDTELVRMEKPPGAGRGWRLVGTVAGGHVMP